MCNDFDLHNRTQGVYPPTCQKRDDIFCLIKIKIDCFSLSMTVPLFLGATLNDNFSKKNDDAIYFLLSLEVSDFVTYTTEWVMIRS